MSLTKVALLTGGNGYIGSKLAAYLLVKGWTVFLITRSLKCKNIQEDKCKQYEYDGTIDSLYQIPNITTSNCVVFHLAAYSSINNNDDNAIKSLYDSNILFGTHLLMFMRRRRLCRIIYAETYWQFGGNGEYAPNTLYAASKMAFTDILKYFSRDCIDSTCLVLYDVYSLDDTRPKLLNYLLSNKDSNKVINLSPGRQIIDYVHVEDVIEAFRLAGDLSLGNDNIGFRRYAIRSMEERTLQEYIEIIEREIKPRYKICWGGADYPVHQIMTPWLPSKDLSPPGWVPKLRFSEVFKRYKNEVR